MKALILEKHQPITKTGHIMEVKMKEIRNRKDQAGIHKTLTSIGFQPPPPPLIFLKKVLSLIAVGILISSNTTADSRDTSKKIEIQRSNQQVLASKSSKKLEKRKKGQTISQKWTEANWNRLPVKDKIRLHQALITTMVALEMDRRSSKSSHLLRLLIRTAYAQASGGCFFAGHFEERCNRNRIYGQDKNKCTIGNREGVRCDGDLFPTAPCVYKLGYGQNNRRIRGYATTQACAYSDAIRMKKYLTNNEDLDFDSIRRWREANQSDEIEANSVMDQSLWTPVDPNAWMEKTEGLLKEGGSDEFLEKYYQTLRGKPFLRALEQIADICEQGNLKRFEYKHCAFFQKELERLNIKPDDIEAPTECFSFAKLPGEHFCQVQAGKDYMVVRLHGNASPNTPHPLTAVVYKSDKPDGEYCKDDRFDNPKSPPSDSTVKPSNIEWPERGTCATALFKSKSTDLTRVIGPDGGLTIDKKDGSNLCSIGVIDGGRLEHWGRGLPPFDDNKYFIPGIDINEDTFYINRLQRELNALVRDERTEISKCIESDVVAAKEAALAIRHHKECVRKGVKIYKEDHRIAERTGGDVPGVEVRHLTDQQFLYNHRWKLLATSNALRHPFSQSPIPLKTTTGGEMFGRPGGVQ